MTKNVLFVLPVVFLFSCNFLQKKPTQNSDQLKAKQSMLEADKAFSKMSGEKGMRKAFMEYIDDNGIMLRPGNMPIVGANAVDLISQMDDDKGVRLIWEPLGSDMAQSGDLGYTYGIYTLKAAGADSIQHGTYVNIWRRQDDGSWKFVLDSGNEGTGQ